MILRKIKRLLGLESRSEEGRTETEVTVEREPETEREEAVEGVETGAGEGDVDEPVAAGGDAEASTESLVDEQEAQEEAAGRAEPGEAAGPETEDERTDVENVEPGAAESEPSEEEAAPSESEEIPAEIEGEGEVDEPVAAGGDAEASTESLVDEHEAQEEAAGRAEPGEAAGPESEDERTDVENVEPAETTTEEHEGVSVTEIKGIGPAYGERLAEVDVHTVDQLASADAANLAERITVSEKRIQRWIDRAVEYES